MSIFQRIANRYLEARGWQLPRESFLPKEFQDQKPITPEGTDLAIWTYEKPLVRNPNRLGYFLLIFKGKQMNKPLAQFYYGSEAERAKSMEEYITNNRAHHDSKKKDREEKKNFKTSLFFGDILYTSWGYDQTNVDFYEVVEVIGDKMDRVLPVSGKYVGPEMRVRVTKGYKGADGAKIEGHYASKWDGHSVYQTPFGMGH
jgi:hypothetical protein